MNNLIVNLMVSCAFLITSHLTPYLGNWTQEDLSGSTPSFRDIGAEQLGGLKLQLENFTILDTSFQEPVNWDLNIEGFSTAYYDKVRKAIAINTVEQPTDQWAAATTSFEHPSGIYTIRFTSLLESDGECSYILRVGGQKVMEFQNPKIYGKDIEEYAPHEVEVMHIPIEAGSVIQVEFFPHSNGMVPEGDGFGFARARWKSNIEFKKESSQ